MRRSLLLGLALAATFAGSSAAQEAGGIAVAPEAVGGLSGLARLPDPVFPGIAAQSLEARMVPADRQAGHQAMIARLRGDPGYLGGFAFGQPLAPSRMLPLAAPPFGLVGPGLADPGGLVLQQPVVIDNFGGPIAVANGDGNVIQQATAGSGTVGQQQIANLGGAPSAVLSALAPASIACAELKPVHGQAASKMRQHGHGPPEKEQPAAIGGNVLVGAGAEAEEVAELIVASAEPGGRSRALEAPHGSVSAFDAPVVLLQPIVQVAAGPVPHRRPSSVRIARG